MSELLKDRQKRRQLILQNHIMNLNGCAGCTNSELGVVCNSCVNFSSSKFEIRPLEIGDYSKGFPEVLQYLTEVGNVSKEQFQETFNAMQKHGGLCRDPSLGRTPKGFARDPVCPLRVNS